MSCKSCDNHCVIKDFFTTQIVSWINKRLLRTFRIKILSQGATRYYRTRAQVLYLTSYLLSIFSSVLHQWKSKGTASSQLGLTQILLIPFCLLLMVIYAGVGMQVCERILPFYLNIFFGCKALSSVRLLYVWISLGVFPTKSFCLGRTHSTSSKIQDVWKRQTSWEEFS